LLEGVVRRKAPCRRRIIKRAERTGAWLSVPPSIVNGTELSRREFRDALLMRYGITPPDLPKRCDGCDANFTLQHALSCKKGGLVIFRHNEIRDELTHLLGKALTPSAIRDEPLIQTCRNANGANGTPDKSDSENTVRKDQDRGDIFARGIWKNGYGCIIDVRATDTDQPTHCKRDPDSVILSQEKEKKKKYLEPCLEQRRHFTPFVVSTDGLLGREASTLAKRIAQKLAIKWQRPYSQTCGYVNARLSIAIVRATNLCMRGSRIPAHKMSNKFPMWEDGAGLALFER
jgi:hypothetical protein